MRQPTLRLTNRGAGRETVRVVPMIPVPDDSGNETYHPDDPGPPIPAVIRRNDGKSDFGNGTEQGLFFYTVMFLCAEDPGIKLGWQIIPNSMELTLVAQTATVRRTAGCWTCDASGFKGA